MARYALCIGINDYPGKDNDLNGCVNDARDWSAEFKKRGFQVQTLLDKSATGNNMRNAILSVVKSAKSGDTAVIQYSGHGSFVPDENGDESDGMDECLCPYDLNSNGLITDDELFDIYNQAVKGAKIIMISDSCHSGSVTRFAPIMTPTMKGAKTSQRKVRFLPPAAFLTRRELAKLAMVKGVRASNPPGRYASLLMAGCQDKQYSYDAYFQGRPNGAFTFVALKALAKLKASATYEQWYRLIKTMLPSQEYPQAPNLYGTSSMKKWKVLV